jgi:hypothetical protein
MNELSQLTDVSLARLAPAIQHVGHKAPRSEDGEQIGLAEFPLLH